MPQLSAQTEQTTHLEDLWPEQHGDGAADDALPHFVSGVHGWDNWPGLTFSRSLMRRLPQRLLTVWTNWPLGTKAGLPRWKLEISLQ